MTITLPDELTEPLSWIGLVWPEADEDKLLADGRTWIDYGSRLRADAEKANAAARQVWTDNYGESIEAFEQWWNGEGPGHHLDKAATAVELIGAALIAFAGVTIALKTAFIAQLIALAIEVGQAIASAFVTAGATLAEIPGWIALTRIACRKLIQKAIAAVEAEIARLLRKAATLLEKAGRRDLAATVLTRSENTAFKGLMREVELADVRSPVNGANFYSGRAADGTRMREFADRNTNGVDSVTLEQTPGGGYFDRRGLYEADSPISKAQADQVWGRLSERYAESAEGEVTAWAHDPWSGSVWLTRERPALERNPNVTDIKVIDPSP